MCSYKMSLLKYEDLYTKGDFEGCKQSLDQLLSNTREYGHLASTSEYYLPEGVSSDSVWNFILENNFIVVKALELNVKNDCTRLEWDGIVQDLCHLHVKLKVLRAVGKVPMELQLNVVYNILWWAWINPVSALHLDDSSMAELFNILSECFNLISGIPSGMPTLNSTALILNQMQRTVDSFFGLGRTESYQLLEIYVLTVHVLLESKDICSFADQIATVVRMIWTNFKIRFPEYIKSGYNCAKIQPKLFKFGFLCLNDSVDGSDAQLLMEVLCITSSLCFIHLGRVDESLEFFTYETEKLQFLWNYLQAYAYYNVGELQMALLHMKKISVVNLDNFSKALYHLLFGEVLIQLKDPVAAIQQFRKTAEIPEYHWLAVYHIVCSLKSRTSLHGADGSLLNNEIVAQDRPGNLNFPTFTTEYTSALKHLFEIVTCDEPFDNISYHLSFEHKILKKVYPRPGITKPKMLYLIAKDFFRLKDHQSAVDAFLHLLDSLNLSETLNGSSFENGNGLFLPPVRVVYHETVAAMLMCGHSIEDAETLCAKLIEYRLRPEDEHCKGVENSLLLLEEDVVALMLMADIHNRKGQYEQENDCLNRCRKAIFKYFFREGGQSSMQEADSNPCIIIHALISRVYLKKALHFDRKKFTNDALLNFKRAFEHNPGDEDVVHYFLAFAKRNNIVEKGLDNPSAKSFPIERCSSVALKYLLSSQEKIDECNVSGSHVQHSDPSSMRSTLLGNLLETIDCEREARTDTHVD